jgi:Na+/proline symporter
MLYYADSDRTAAAIAYALRGRQMGRWVWAKSDCIAAATVAEMEQGKVVFALTGRGAIAGLLCGMIISTVTFPLALSLANRAGVVQVNLKSDSLPTSEP